MPIIQIADFVSDAVDQSWQQKTFYRDGHYYAFFSSNDPSDGLYYKHAASIADLLSASRQSVGLNNVDQPDGNDYALFYDDANDRVGITWIKGSDDTLRFVIAGFHPTTKDIILSTQHQASNTLTDVQYPVVCITTSGKWGIAVPYYYGIGAYWNYKLFYSDTTVPTGIGNWGSTDIDTNVDTGGSPKRLQRISKVGTGSNDKILCVYKKATGVSKLWNGSSLGGSVAIGEDLESPDGISNAVIDNNGDVHIVFETESGGEIRAGLYDETAGTWSTILLFTETSEDIKSHSLQAQGNIIHYFGGDDNSESFIYWKKDGAWSNETGNLTGDLADSYGEIEGTPTVSHYGDYKLLVLWVDSDEEEIWMDEIFLAAEPTIVTEETSVDQLKGKCWELGVALPFRNMALDKYEKTLDLFEQVTTSDNSLSVINGDIYDRKAIKSGMKIFIGPSSNKDKDINGEFINYGKIFKAIIILTSYDGGNSTETFIRLDANLNATYEAGDNVTIRGIALCWDFLREKYFPGVASLPTMCERTETEDKVGGNSYWPKKYQDAEEGDGENDNEDLVFDRVDPIFERRGYSQQMQVNNSSFCGWDCEDIPIVDKRIGIIQLLQKKTATYLLKLRNKNIRISCWHRYRAKGLIYDSMYLGFVQYDKPWLVDAASVVSNDVVNITDDLNFSTDNRLITGIIAIDSTTISAGLYNYIDAYNVMEETEVDVDDIVAEHVVGTSQEEYGFYTFPKLPQAGTMSVNTSRLPRTAMKSSGDTEDLFIKDPVLRFSVVAEFHRVNIDFINDMMKFQDYSNKNNVLALRTHMYDSFPPVLFCRMKMDRPKLRDERGYDMYDVKIEFEEVLA